MMKLSAAIRIGSMTTKQITGRVTDGGNGRCAIGAALDAVGMVPRQEWGKWYGQFREAFPQYWYIVDDIWIANDQEHKTREQIADWVEQWENENLQATPIEAKPIELIAQEAK